MIPGFMPGADPLGRIDNNERKVSAVVPKDGTLTTAKREELRDAVTKYRDVNELSNARLARGIGVSDAYVSQALSGKLAPNLGDPVLRRLNDWIEEHARGAATRAPDNLVMIAPAKRLVNLAKWTIATCDISLGEGPAGIGKTLTCKYIAEKHAAIYIRVTRDTASGVGLLRGIYAALNRGRWPSRRVNIASIVEEFGHSGRLLIIDQAQDLADDAFRVIMDLHDVGEIPVMLVGTYDVRKRLDKDRNPLQGQLSSRAGKKVALLPEATRRSPGGQPAEWVTIEQIRAIFERGNVKLHGRTVNEIKRMLTTYPFADGLLRKVKKIVQNAVMMLTKGDASAEALITLDVFRHAYEMYDPEEQARTAAAEEPTQEAATA